MTDGHGGNWNAFVSIMNDICSVGSFRLHFKSLDRATIPHCYKDYICRCYAIFGRDVHFRSHTGDHVKRLLQIESRGFV